MKYLICLLTLVMFSNCGKIGPTGPVGPTGETGATGNQGPQGSPGVNGTNGTNGTSPTIVQFCGSCVTHYPDTFAEIGFCFNGTIYATYSTNDGFSSAIPAGTYSSNGVNCSCNFTVGSNCSISN